MATAKNVSTTAVTNWFRQKATNVAASDAAVGDGFTGTKPANDTLISMTAPNGRRYRGIQLMPFGTDADNEAFTADIQFVKKVSAVYGTRASGSGTDVYQVYKITTLTMTLDATSVGVSGGIVLDTDIFADTITQAITTFGTTLESAYGTAAVIFSPADDATPAIYILPDVGGADWVRIRLITGTSATQNCLVSLTS